MRPRINGIRLGPGSPLLTKGGRVSRRNTGLTEFDIQAAAMELLVGPTVAGRARSPGGGLTPKYPELYLLHAIPNGGHRLKRAAGRAKAEGVLASVPDLHLPAARLVFHSLYIEVKRPGERPTPEQRLTHERLQLEGNAVVVCTSTKAIVAVATKYLDLPHFFHATGSTAGLYRANGYKTLEGVNHDR